ncbi:uncharacterized protein EI90DRAFT_2593968 [Cantharellus anzutake]|uniref:uncharacterized protein n=1 Tax=Cantharellus anzutake TaxID=1750568 RepID=UPI00190706F0|nr:uncharacterized protein EI90DRAFT_2593968 [Cantharellus anzutake]KAF8321034.1 hypothetical protein EI90DRAFT_2593968 [Cantharellus anzutake]
MFLNDMILLSVLQGIQGSKQFGVRLSEKCRVRRVEVDIRGLGYLPYLDVTTTQLTLHNLRRIIPLVFGWIKSKFVVPYVLEVDIPKRSSSPQLITTLAQCTRLCQLIGFVFSLHQHSSSIQTSASSPMMICRKMGQYFGDEQAMAGKMV